MFYRFLRGVVCTILYLVNGRARYVNQDNLPEGPYVLVGPHRTWFDPVYFAMAAYPRKFSFMAKEELFQNPIFRWLLKHVNGFPVNRDHPGPSAIKTPVRILRQGDLSLIMFPSGSRHSNELKGGAAVIAKMAGVPLVPAVYQGPLTFKQLFTRKPVTIAFGKPIEIDRKLKLNEEGQAQIEQQMQAAFDQLDREIDPTFHYVDVTEKKDAHTN
ncbi:lysophospholipid acyltransferase family protein [Levilactobacillus brevis]|jgi:1-acyl-sn-glycerol-3-phosphate acyltransferase|uniref:1-acyl-sn-glycerol-3-phosphate acyltransferase n=1 Tax=Levilactobacillus brevis (strain ATCC 367 / BCRC 12310 / CIP 105137 / JCM 1170 / LMG 11437 / NCIMB 947 / NCTC 947) TaxID=387344 RepID=Q03QR6_LEVBA|nr:1-acyl-sn-glycerol-3-phosphate acyltransferase [Levilactobacillus brevis]MBL3536811.1 1-acyl-sn-glycerol-3-phosphate acyltransferase [Lactobacillus sp. GPR40-2]MBL3630081.1 1-acyl-sn-glycerol-3-phosphate acyltransferase [Lactobacillus sp. GPB7-4]ABJ64456.1 1-acyl-sn-glycerol-3-phosphate acyltransferase [Levilactobacillus brevis ATCC 367]ARQ94110.1 acyl-phosphate glycerol 3-phosphate acyltransferase [Levilactobacillus brevis]ARW22288.1 1-acylglycerol-3-phosphate O-acyltransferase [Levilactob